MRIFSEPFFRFSALTGILVLGIVGASRAKSPRLTLKFVEVYGSSKLKGDDIREKLSDDISALVSLQHRGSSRDSKRAGQLERRLEKKVKTLGGLGWVKLHIIDLPEEEEIRPLLLHFEVIEKEDMATRLPFRSNPTGKVSETAALIASWYQYSSIGKKLESESASIISRQECPAYYCVWGAMTPELAKLQEGFVAAVPSQREFLVKTLAEDADPKARAGALFLLSYLQDGALVSHHAAFSLMDSDQKVRDAALTILNDITVYRKETAIPIHEINRLLDVPYPEDRTKALALMLNLSDNKDYRRFILHTGSKSILKLLRSRHPNNHSMAHTVLSLLSSESFGERDYDAWDRWIWKERQADEIPPKK